MAGTVWNLPLSVGSLCFFFFFKTPVQCGEPDGYATVHLNQDSIYDRIDLWVSGHVGEYHGNMPVYLALSSPCH